MLKITFTRYDFADWDDDELEEAEDEQGRFMLVDDHEKVLAMVARPPWERAGSAVEDELRAEANGLRKELEALREDYAKVKERRDNWERAWKEAQEVNKSLERATFEARERGYDEGYSKGLLDGQKDHPLQAEVRAVMDRRAPGWQRACAPDPLWQGGTMTLGEQLHRAFGLAIVAARKDALGEG